MATAWRVCDKAAREAGNLPGQPDCWEVALDDGMVAVIVRQEEMAGLVQDCGREKVVYTLEEIARLLKAYPTLAKAKAAFPGATVTKISVPLDRADNLFSDKLPF